MRIVSSICSSIWSSIWWLRNLLYDNRPIWYLIFLIPCVFGVLVDPLFLYLPILNQDTKCIRLDRKLKIVILTLRSISDFCYIVDLLFLQVTMGERLTNVVEARESLLRRTSYISQVPRIIISDVGRIARTIWLSHTLIDILAVLPIPQVVIFFDLFNKLRGSSSTYIWIFLNFLILFQYIPRVVRIYQLLKDLETNPNARKMMMRSVTSVSKLVKGVCMFFLFILASHVFGALWYFFAYQRAIACWQHVCQSRSTTGCEESIFDCDGNHGTFKNVTLLSNLCPISPANATEFDFGIFLEVLQSGMFSSRDFSQKFWRCFWWGLRNLSSFGQNLQTGSYAWENIFAVFISLSGMFLVLIYLSAILQLYMESATTTWKQDKKSRKLIAKRNPEIAAWLEENDLPLDLKEKIMTSILTNLEPDVEVNILSTHPILRLEHVTEIKHCLCLPILKKIPRFRRLEDKKLQKMCSLARPVIYNESGYIIREGEPLNTLLLITQGTATTYRAYPHESSSSLSIKQEFLRKGDFYGEELLACAFKSDFSNLPASPKSVKCCTKVEGFILDSSALTTCLRSINLAPKTRL